MNNSEDSSGMRPKKGSISMSLPITFDYSGGRGESEKSKKLWSWVLSFVGLFIGIGIIFNKEGLFAVNLLFGILEIFAVSLIVRFFLLNEGKIRKEYLELEKDDYAFSTKNMWGIYEISNQDPYYYCRFRNGMSGLFVRLNKDVILGKYSDSEFEHYEAIADALNLAGADQVKICHIDYMDNVGTDERLVKSFVELGQVTNPDVKDVLTDIFSYQQHQMMRRVTTFDIYLFKWTGSDINALNTIQRILNCFLEANYRSYHVLNQNDLREFTKILFNLHEFSTVDAMLNVFSGDTYNGVKPIEKITSDGSVVKYNKTILEKKEEQAQKQKEQELKKEELKKRKEERKSKGKKHNKKQEDEIDLF